MKKKIIGILLVLCLCLTMLGCSKKADKISLSLTPENAQQDTLLLKSDKSVQAVVVDGFAKDYYNKDELQKFIESKLEEYNQEAGKGSAILESLESADDKVKGIFTYKSLADYTTINENFVAEGYITTRVLSLDEAVSEGILPASLTEAKSGDAVSSDQVTKEKKCSVVVLNSKTKVMIEGTILYYSGVSYIDEHSVQTSGEETAVIVYR